LIAFFWPGDDCFSTSDADDSESDELGDDFRFVFERFLVNFLGRPTPNVDWISWSDDDELETTGSSCDAFSVLCPKFSRRITNEIRRRTADDDFDFGAVDTDGFGLDGVVGAGQVDVDGCGCDCFDCDFVGGVFMTRAITRLHLLLL